MTVGFYEVCGHRDTIFPHVAAMTLVGRREEESFRQEG